MFRISNVSKKMVGVCALFSTLFIFNACGDSESDLKNLALEKCKEKAESLLNNKYFPYEKVTNTEIISFEKNDKRKDEFYKAECKIGYVLNKDYGESKKGDNYFQKSSIFVKKSFDNATGKDKWVAYY
ncbi:hypothetical protein DCO58_10255 [Helicobacter saguini]|uniref:Lipoprotein n=1 Tax=Helicobacter saguini TaxID=1548018 RepID=A0A347VPK7_9HELI|nr:hypothetical protein [Helicobacter saguini]MWV61314.1 hypothetical protein [Helicobacter saguini]MWV68017.1 hypothetical protein [Helicobacter saguini]MWV70516.1 hypothetical protein [Helicobacter saguini]MWV72419.1 hypothetical protein [Helicobacter saguini]TLD94816.1 hypothetical protein LS64_004800 [Helicobacter saguini]